MSDAYVCVDPGRRAGEPCINGTRIPTHMIASLVWDAGMKTVRHCWPSLTEAQILVACWFEVAHGNRRKWRRRYPDWPRSYSRDEWLARGR